MAKQQTLNNNTNLNQKRQTMALDTRPANSNPFKSWYAHNVYAAIHAGNFQTPV